MKNGLFIWPEPQIYELMIGSKEDWVSNKPDQENPQRNLDRLSFGVEVTFHVNIRVFRISLDRISLSKTTSWNGQNITIDMTLDYVIYDNGHGIRNNARYSSIILTLIDYNVIISLLKQYSIPHNTRYLLLFRHMSHQLGHLFSNYHS